MRLSSTLLLSAASIAIAGPAAAQFAPGGPTISGTVGAQTLSTGTGTINAGGAISIASGAAVPLTMTGTATLINNGTIQTLGTGRAIDSNAGTASLTVTNTGLISAVSTDAFRINTAASSVTLTNGVPIQVTAGGQAIDWAEITTGTNKLTNSGIITSVGDDAVRPGVGGVINNSGTISATPTGTTAPSGSDGIDLRSNAGIAVTNSGTISGRHGITGNASPTTLTVDNKAGGIIQGVNGSGLNIDTVNPNVVVTVTNAAGATIRGGVLAAATNGDGDGIDVDGVLNLTNAGQVLGFGAKGVGSDTFPNNPEAIAAGGGTIVNTATGRIIGSASAADAPNGDSSRAGNGILIDNSSGGAAIAATTLDNAGLVQGKSGVAVKIVGSFADTIANKAGGTLQGGGTVAAVQTDAGADSVSNAGTITTTAATAVDLGADNDTMTIEGSAAAVTGDMDGGAGFDILRFNLTTAGTFVYGDEILNFESIFLDSGTVTLSKVYKGATTQVFGGTLRFLGDQRGNSDFLNLVGDARVNGHTAGYGYDGTYTFLTQVPEPGTIGLFATGLAGLAAWRRRNRTL